MIEGVVVTPLKQFFDERGKVMHMLHEEAPHFKHFGEIYFSCTNPGAVKAWHMHKKMTLNYAVVFGSIKCVLYDDRPDSKSKGELQEFFMSPENYFLLTVPPLVWNGWKGIGDKNAAKRVLSRESRCRYSRKRAFLTENYQETSKVQS